MMKKNVVQHLVDVLRPMLKEQVAACNGDVRLLREIFNALSDTRDFGFCCDHITTEDLNTDDGSITFCVVQAVERGHIDCLVMLLMIEACDEELRTQVLEYAEGKR